MSNVRRWSFRWWRGLIAVVMACVSHWTMAQGPATPARPLVEIRTTLGVIVVALYNETPLHRDNFLKLARAGAYDSLLFHRAIPGFMAQGGDPDSRRAKPLAPLGDGGPGHTLPAEIHARLVHLRGALAAAREPDEVNPERRSSGSQFFLVQGRAHSSEDLARVIERNARYGNTVTYSEEQRKAYTMRGGAPHLDGAYTVFGEVVEGLEVLDAICGAPTDSNDRPLTDIRIFVRPLE
jgi:cyclophilin family peptidyl-prolyl cis-trans isomerase